MKNLWIGVFLLCVPLFAELSVKKIDNMVEQIQGKRKSKVKVEFDKVSSPFATVVHKKDVKASPVIKVVEQRVAFNVGAIINGKAMINGQWVKAGDKIEGYTVESVEENRVVLKKTNRTVELFLPNPKKNNLLKISEG